MNMNQALADVIKNQGILKFVDIGPNSLNQGVLSVDKLEQFVREMKENTVLLDAARVVLMKSFKKDIDRISMNLDLEPLSRDKKTGQVSRTDQDPIFNLNTLNAQTLTAHTRLTAEALEDNIETGTLANTILTLFGGAGGRSLERIFIYGNTSKNDAQIKSGYKTVDGWIRKCTNTLFGKETKSNTKNMDFNPDQKDPTKDDYILTRMVDALDTNYLERAVFFVPTQKAREYQRALKNRNSALGDQANLQNGQLTFEGYPVIPVPALDEPVKDPKFFGPEVLFFGDPANFVYGLWKDITIRSEEDMYNEMWRFYLRLRGDCHFEDETKTVCALPSVSKPENPETSNNWG
jgi:HK97 family phage major capsid protein